MRVCVSVSPSLSFSVSVSLSLSSLAPFLANHCSANSTNRLHLKVGDAFPLVVEECLLERLDFLQKRAVTAAVAIVQVALDEKRPHSKA